MAHELEFVDGQACMAYAGDEPWHGLGVKVSPDLSPEQMLHAVKNEVRKNREIVKDRMTVEYN